MMVAVTRVALALVDRLDLVMVVKSTILLGFGLVAVPFASRARAAMRHLLMAATLGSVLVLPLVGGTVPEITVRVPVSLTELATGMVSSQAPATPGPGEGILIRGGTNEGARPSIAAVVRSVWALGGIFLLVILAVDLRRLRVVRRGGLPFPAQTDLRTLTATSGLRRSVEVLLHESVSAPLTCGLWRPVILLPIDAIDWQEADLRRALVHELEHVRRCDWATQLLARVVCACYWFHPLVWLAWARLRLEAERACDDAVLQSAECTEYAEQLVTLARRMSTARALPSLAMANRTDLSARVSSLLDVGRPRGRVGYVTTASVLGVAGLVLVLLTSIRAIAAPTPSPQTVPIAEPARESVSSTKSPDRDIPVPSASVRPTRRAKPTRGTIRPAQHPSDESAAHSRESIVDPPTIRPLINRSGSRDGTGSAERTVIGSSTASGTATHSASASSSSN
jgi:beta-lactamase regulating signal transducer with metallopeptidase domain